MQYRIQFKEASSHQLLEKQPDFRIQGECLVEADSETKALRIFEERVTIHGNNDRVVSITTDEVKQVDNKFVAEIGVKIRGRR